MATTKRTIRGEKYDISKLVDDAVSRTDDNALNVEPARTALARMGHTNPSDAIVNKYARESAILAELERLTGAAFSRQIGKIEFSNRDRAILQVNAYLNRRNAGHRSRWGK